MSKRQREVSARTTEDVALDKVANCFICIHVDNNSSTKRSYETAKEIPEKEATEIESSDQIQGESQEVDAENTNSCTLDTQVTASKELSDVPEYTDVVDGDMPSDDVQRWHYHDAEIASDSLKSEVNENESPAINLLLPDDVHPIESPDIKSLLPDDVHPNESPAINLLLPDDVHPIESPDINLLLPDNVHPIESPDINLLLPDDVHPIESPDINYDTIADNRPQPQEKEKIHSLSQTLLAQVSLNDKNGSAIFMHPKSMVELNNSKNLQKLQNKKVRRLDLLFKINKQFIATDEDAANAVVEIQYVRGNRNMKHRVARCSKEYYDIEGCTMLRCHDVPIEVSEYLEKSYLQLLNLVIQICTEPTFTRMFFVIGHLEGESKCHFSGNLFERFTMSSQDYEYLSLEELADHFFMRTMEIKPDEWYKIRQTICPGDESLFVVRFERDRVAHLL